MALDDEPTRHTYPTGLYGAPVSPAPQYGPQQLGPQEYSTAQFAPPQGFPPVPRKKRSRRVELVVVAVIVLVALGVLGTFAYAKIQASSGPSTATMRSACEKGIRDEYNRRVAGNDSQYVVAALSSIVVSTEVHREDARHYTIDASFTATAAAALVGSIPINVLVSCQISTSGSDVATVSVVNR